MAQSETADNPRFSAPSDINRRLAAIAFADVAGFSRLISINDLETLQRWRTLRMEIMEPHMARHKGRVVESAGDALMVEFSSAVNAVRWAVDVQRSQRTSPDASGPLALRIRIGVNVDDIIDDAGMLQGNGVNIAARIHQAAEPGQIVVTAAVRDYVMNRLPVTFHDLGSPPLKNIARPVRVFSVEWHENGERELVTQPYLQWSARPTIAVLPFRNIGGADEESYFGEGITEDIITGLSRSRSLYVIARNSTLRYRDRTKDMRETAVELDVRYVLDGSVRRQGTCLRINAELMDVAANRAIWAQRFEGATDDLFKFQDQIAASILGSLEPQVHAAEAARIRDRPTESLYAYDCVLKAMSRLYLLTAASDHEAGELLERAVALDATYGRAHAYLAWWLVFRISEGRSQDLETDRRRAVIASQRATELDREDAFILAVAGHVVAYLKRQPTWARDRWP